MLNRICRDFFVWNFMLKIENKFWKACLNFVNVFNSAVQRPASSVQRPASSVQRLGTSFAIS